MLLSFDSSQLFVDSLQWPMSRIIWWNISHILSMGYIYRPVHGKLCDRKINRVSRCLFFISEIILVNIILYVLFKLHSMLIDMLCTFLYVTCNRHGQDHKIACPFQQLLKISVYFKFLIHAVLSTLLMFERKSFSLKLKQIRHIVFI